MKKEEISQNVQFNKIAYRLIERNFLKSLQIFALSFQIGGLKKLYRKTGISVGKISKYIAYLEEDLEVKIISKTKNEATGSFFTEEASKLYNIAVDILEGLEIAERKIRNFKKKEVLGSPRGRYLIRIDTNAFGFREILPSIIKEYIEISEFACFHVNIYEIDEMLMNIKNSKTDVLFFNTEHQEIAEIINRYKDLEFITIELQESMQKGIQSNNNDDATVKIAKNLKEQEVARFNTDVLNSNYLEGFISYGIQAPKIDKSQTDNKESKGGKSWYIVYQKDTELICEIRRMEKLIRVRLEECKL